MPKYIIEREMPGVGNMSGTELAGAAQKSNAVLMDMGPEVQWVQSYVTDDKIYCVYISPNADLVREHAEKAGFPANSVQPVVNIIDPATADA